jgi:tRNA-2-methylthio-N6-dimethylallyladenosine synthase
MNYSDAERIATILEKHKMKSAASINEADLIVFVTCGVRQSAEDRVYGLVNNIRKKYPKKKIVLTGCLARRKDVQRRLKNKVNLFCEISKFPREIKKIPDTGYRIPDTQTVLCNDYLEITPKYVNRYTAYIPIMTGCDNFCAYCVVPAARGREYSRPAEDILKEAKGLIKKGYKEIILLGQNVNSYNSRIRTNEKQIGTNICSHSLSFVPDSRVVNFPLLLRLIEKIPGKFWLTFLTSHPKDMSDELIRTIAESKKICEYVSLPAQAGDNEVLRRMNRKYTIGHYKNLVKKIRRAYLEAKLPIGSLASNPAISTDIIVGFPGETRKQFENTAKLLRELKFDMAYIAQYSPRPETAAWQMKDSVSKKEKSRREKVLTKILEKTALANNKKYVGKVIEVLVDQILSSPRTRGSRSKKLDSRVSGNGSAIKYLAHTRTQKKVLFSSDKKIPVGSFAKVKITKAKAFGLEGEVN